MKTPIPSPVPFVARLETGRPGATLYPFAMRGRTIGAALVAVLDAVPTGDGVAVADAVLKARARNARARAIGTGRAWGALTGTRRGTGNAGAPVGRAIARATSELH